MKEIAPFLLSCRSSTAFKLRHIAQSPSYRYFTSLHRVAVKTQSGQWVLSAKRCKHTALPAGMVP